jgi:hypothetical protein
MCRGVREGAMQSMNRFVLGILAFMMNAGVA